LHVVDDMVGVTQLDDVVYIVCRGSSIILRFSTTTHRQLTDINVKDLRSPWDIAACEQTSQLYVADDLECVRRVSSDAEDIKHWLPTSSLDRFKPWSQSVTSSRLLVTSRDPNQLIQCDACGDELRHVCLPDYMEPFHAVESPTGTFIVSHRNTQLNQWQVSEVNTEGRVLRHFSGSRLIPLGYAPHIAVDSQGNIFVADWDKSRILLLDARLSLRRVIIDEHQLNYEQPQRLCYMEQSGQLLVVFDMSIAVFNVLCR